MRPPGFKTRFVLRLTACLLLIVCGALPASQTWHWKDRFSGAERENLVDWVQYAHAGMESLFGDLPYSYDVYFHRSNDGNQPVPWAHTRKGRRSRAVNFYVNPVYSSSELKKDWTAYHELSHLMFPYLGDNGKWFAEGVASYLQYQVMYAAGELSWEDAIDRYRGRFEAALQFSDFDESTIVELSNAGWQSGWNVRLYWGGAAYFMEVDRRLHDDLGMRLTDVIRDYLDCCFGSRGRGPIGMIRTFDRLSQSSIFSDVYRDTVKQKGFPATERSLAWLTDNPPPAVEKS